MIGCVENQGLKRNSQLVSDDPLFLINNLDYCSTNDNDTALIYTIKLMELEPSLVIEMIQKDVTWRISDNQKCASTFINELKSVDITDLDEIIEPVYIWNKIRNTKSSDSLLVLYNDLDSILTHSILSDCKPEFYLLKSLDDLNTKGIISDETRKRVNHLINQEAKKKLDISYPLNTRDLKDRRAYLRLLLRYTFFNLFELTKKSDYLKMASFYSPDIMDREHPGGYVYESIILTGDQNNFDYQQNYLDYLLLHKRKKEALSVLTIMTINEPINTNIIRLKSLLLETNPTKNFRLYWYDVISNNSVIFPELTFTTIDSISISSEEFKGKWTLIDIWGTWCSPCISELPELESFYRDSLRNYNNQLEILTLSSNSENLIHFMDKNNYTFPVAEIERNIVKELKINGYPTKILVFPDGKYRVIPFGVNWIEYINNYSLINKKLLLTKAYTQ